MFCPLFSTEMIRWGIHIWQDEMTWTFNLKPTIVLKHVFLKKATGYIAKKRSTKVFEVTVFQKPYKNLQKSQSTYFRLFNSFYLLERIFGRFEWKMQVLSANHLLLISVVPIETIFFDEEKENKKVRIYICDWLSVKSNEMRYLILSCAQKN